MPEVVLRKLSEEEEDLLAAKLRDKKMSVRNYERYRIIKEASQGRRVSEIADRVSCHFTVVYDWIKRFNESGFSTFERPPNPEGRISTISSEQIRELIKVALSRPEDLELPFTTWSVRKLNRYCRKKGILPEVTDEWVRRLLRREGITHQRTKTWMDSPDPEFEVKKTASWSCTRDSRREVSSSVLTSSVPWSSGPFTVPDGSGRGSLQGSGPPTRESAAPSSSSPFTMCTPTAWRV